MEDLLQEAGELFIFHGILQIQRMDPNAVQTQPVDICGDLGKLTAVTHPIQFAC